MSHLLREHAPITATGWSLIDDEARERLTPALAARKLIDFAGPHGWQHSATNLGRIEPIAKPPAAGLDGRAAPGAPAGRAARAVRDRRAPSSPTPTAARRTSTSTRSTTPPARWPWPRTPPSSTAGRHAGITGIAEASRTTRRAGEDCERYPRHVAKAVEALLAAGIDGPYGLALGPEPYTRVLETERAWRLPAARAPAQDPRRPARLGARRERRRRRQPARRRLPVRVGARTSRSATTGTTATPSTSISKRASASGSSPRRRPSRWLRKRPSRRAGLLAGNRTESVAYAMYDLLTTLGSPSEERRGIAW